MSHIENIKRLFTEFKRLSESQNNAHRELEAAQAELRTYPVSEPRVKAAEEKLNFLKGKSSVFFREIEKLRGELNSYKNTPNPDLTLASAFDEKLAFIDGKQQSFVSEIEALKQQIAGLSGGLEKRHQPKEDLPGPDAEQASAHGDTSGQSFGNASQQTNSGSYQKKQEYTPPPPKQKTGDMDSAEVFVGQKVFSYIGIGILVIGLALGAKVAIERDWFGELFQVVGGYSAAAILIILGLWLKKKYEGFSVVLVGGGLATAYFMTYASHSYFQYFGQLESFIIMVILTAVTVFTALKYNQELIAILGMVGAYGIPFLLDDGSGRVHIMFTYMAIINLGILAIAFVKYWRGLYYSAFGLTWLIFGSWFLVRYNADAHFHIAVVFMSIYYVTFYSAFLSHKLIQKEEFNAGDITLVLVNSILFFFIGYYILDSTAQGQEYLGLFALGNAVFHFIITLVFYMKKLADKGLFYIEAGMALLFVTIAIPIQFDGKWIPIFFTLEAVILFFIGRIQGIKVYEILSYPMTFIAFFSVCTSLIVDYRPYLTKTGGEAIDLNFLGNEIFLGAALACLGFALLSFLNRIKSKRPESPNGWQVTMDYFLPIMAFALVYFTFFAEIAGYWTQQYNASIISTISTDDWLGWMQETEVIGNKDLLRFRTISIMDYTLVFLGLLAGLNWAIWKNKNFGVILTSVSMFGIFLYAIIGTYAFTDLSESILGENAWSQHFPLEKGKLYLYKYASLAVFVVFTIVQFTTSRALRLGETFSQWNAGLIHLCALIIISHEFLFVADLNGFSNSTKTALSVMWAAYAVVLMAIGITKQRGYLRISAFVIWGIVLTKLLLYDLTHLSLEVKTVVFIAIGVLLLIVSFLYYRVVAKQKQEEATDNGGEEEAGHPESE